MIRGIWGDQAKELHPEQWVSVYWLNAWDAAEYYGTCQVKDLEAIADGEPLENFGLVLDFALDQGQFGAVPKDNSVPTCTVL